MAYSSNSIIRNMIRAVVPYLTYVGYKYEREGKDCSSCEMETRIGRVIDYSEAKRIVGYRENFLKSLEPFDLYHQEKVAAFGEYGYGLGMDGYVCKDVFDVGSEYISRSVYCKAYHDEMGVSVSVNIRVGGLKSNQDVYNSLNENIRKTWLK